MAVDSVAERWSIKDMLAPWRGPVIPDNLISQRDRLHFLQLYTGILAAELQSAVTEYLIHSKAIAQNVVITDTTSSAVLNVVDNTHFILAGSVRRILFSIGIADGSSVDLNAFSIEAQLVRNGRWIEMQSSWGATTDENAFIMYSEDDLENLPHDTKGMAILDVLGMWAIRFKSSLASAPGEPVTRTLEVAAALVK